MNKPPFPILGLTLLLTACSSSKPADAPSSPSAAHVESAPAPAAPPNAAPAASPPPSRPDPIARFIERGRLTGGMAMNNGIDPPLVRAPAGASVDDVLALVYDRRRYARLYDHAVTRYTVVDRRPLPEANGEPSAATILLVDTNLGERLLIVRPEADGWYNREFAIVD